MKSISLSRVTNHICTIRGTLISSNVRSVLDTLGIHLLHNMVASASGNLFHFTVSVGHVSWFLS